MSLIQKCKEKMEIDACGFEIYGIILDKEE